MKCHLVLLLVPALSAFAQNPTGSLGGLVVDPQGAAVPRAKIELADSATGLKFMALSNERGEWALPALPVATYEAAVSATGFKTTVIRDIKIDPATPAAVNVVLELGAVTETIEVQGGAEVLQTTSATISSTLVGEQLADLPFTSRNLTELLVTQPGASTPGIPRSTSMNGLPRGAMNITIDGINVQDNSARTADGFFNAVQPRLDAMEEATVSTAAQTATSSGEGAAQVNFVTRSGTNQWHGGVYWQTRNTALDANFYFNNLNGLPRDRIILNQFGGRLGGPVRRNKLFFFAAYESVRLPLTSPGAATILTPSARQGIFTYQDTATKQLDTVNLFQMAAAANAGLPATVRPYATTPDPILAVSFTQIATLTSAAGSIKSLAASNNDYNRNSYSYQVNGANNRYFPIVRLDYNVTDKQHVEVVWNYQDNLRLPDQANNVIPVFPGTGAVLGSNVITGLNAITFTGVVALRSTISATITNEARYGVQGGDVWFYNEIGPSLFSRWKGYAPLFGPSPSYLTNPYTVSSSQVRNTPVKQFIDNLSWIRGSHILTLGGSLTQVNIWQKIYSTQVIPTITFGIASQDPINTGATSIFTSGNFHNSTPTNLSDAASLYAVLTGRVSAINSSVSISEKSKTYGANPNLDRDRYREMALFAQDAWKVSPGVTLTYGVRWNPQLSYVNLSGIYTHPGYAGVWGVSGAGNLFSPGTLTGSVPQYYPVTSDTRAYPSKFKNFSPSIGIAWSPKTAGPKRWLTGTESVLRAGYAFSTLRPDMAAFTGVWGNNQGKNFSTAVDPVNFPAQFGPPGSVYFSDANLPARSFSTTPNYPFPVQQGNAVYDYNPNLRTEYVQSWELGFQREVTRDTALELNYVGNHAVGLWRNENLNETNIQNNGFLSQFLAAQTNLAIARSATSASVNFGNQGLPGQKDIPMLSTALGFTSDTNTAILLSQGQAGSLATSIANNSARMGRLVTAGYPSNLFWVNPTATGGAFLVTNGVGETYHALQVQVRRRLSRGLLVQAGYTWSHALGNSFFNGLASAPTTLWNGRLDRGPTPWDIRNAFKLNWIYELPLGPGRSFLSNSGNRIIDKALEGWQIASVTRIQSGSPEPLTSARQTFNQNDAGVVLHNLTTGQLQSMMQIRKVTNANGVGAVYFLPQSLVNNSLAAFQIGAGVLDSAQPYVGPPTAPGQLGYRVFLYGPWQQKWDLSLIKITKFAEHKELEFRSQFLNAFNVTNFILSGGIRDPGNSIPLNGGFGQTTNTYRDLANTNDPGGRVIEFVLRVNF
jgi:hypothetical protein